MHFQVVGPEHVKREYPLKLRQGQRRRRLRIRIALLANVRERRPWQLVDAPHERPHQPLDMPAIPRRTHRTVIKLNTMLTTATLQGPRMKLLAVVDVHAARQARNRPRQADFSFRQPRCLGQHCMRQSKRNRRCARRVERYPEPGDHAGIDIQRQREPWPTDRLARDLVHHHHVHRRVIHLQHVQRPAGLQAAGDRSKALRRGAAAPSRARTTSGNRLRRHAPAHRIRLGGLRAALRQSCSTASNSAAPDSF